MKTFKKTYNTNYQFVFNVAMKMINDKMIAADLTQEVFIDLYKQLKGGKEIQNYKAWLYRMVCNKTINLIKKKDYRVTERLNSEMTFVDEHEIGDKKSQFIKNAILQLPENEKLLIVLYSEGLTYKEISDATGIKFTSVGKTLSRILRKMEQELKPKYHELFAG